MNPLTKRITKYVAIGTLGLATFLGSCTSHKDDLPPLYINKTGTSYGICVGGLIDLEPNAKFYGIVLSLANKNAGQINGLELGITANSVQGTNASLNGLEASIIGNKQSKDDGEDMPEKVNGIQLAIGINFAKESGRALQIGIYNKAVDSQDNKKIVRRSIGIGYTGAAQ